MRTFGAAAISLLTVAVVLALSGTAAGVGQKGPQSYYLALGDSIAYGFTRATGQPSPSDTGYVDLFAARLRKLSPKIAVVNYGCPGESSVTFARVAARLREGGKLHDPYRGPQLKAALAFLRAHRGQVSPITLTLWGNDLAPLSARGKPRRRRSRRSPRASTPSSSSSGQPHPPPRSSSPEPGTRRSIRPSSPSRSIARSTQPSHEPRLPRELGSRRCTRSSTRPGTSAGFCALSTSARRAIRIRMTPGTGPWRMPSSPLPATRASPSSARYYRHFAAPSTLAAVDRGVRPCPLFGSSCSPSCSRSCSPRARREARPYPPTACSRSRRSSSGSRSSA